ncbi:MAG: nucleotidyltransferase domain-containing protein [Mogibacterium sp.]|nr:nucleotidyltransferase domain-containing protein [Mogibacterium sp.]
MNTTIKDLRKSGRLTQLEASKLVGIPLRTFKEYENHSEKIGTIKYEYILQKLEELLFIDEAHGILRHEDIVSICSEIFKEYPVYYCYLFGSYSKGTATETSDVDLLVSTDVSGLHFYGLAEKLRSKLKKKVDLITLNQLKDNLELLDEILKHGEKIYVQGQ